MKLQDYYNDYLEFNDKKNLTGGEALAAVKRYGWALQYVKEQTEEICLAAVKQNGLYLRYVSEQTEEICLAAVKQNGLALQFVNEDMFTKNKEEIDFSKLSKESLVEIIKQLKED